jgi:hypothetical protein
VTRQRRGRVVGVLTSVATLIAWGTAPAGAARVPNAAAVHRFLDHLTPAAVRRLTASNGLWQTFLRTDGRGVPDNAWLRFVNMATVKDPDGPPLVVVSWLGKTPATAVERQTLYTYAASPPVRQALGSLLAGARISVAPAVASGRWNGQAALLMPEEAGTAGGLALLTWQGSHWVRVWSVTAQPPVTMMPEGVGTYTLAVGGPVTLRVALRPAAGGTVRTVPEPAVAPVPYWFVLAPSGAFQAPFALGSTMLVAGYIPPAWVHRILVLDWDSASGTLAAQWTVHTAANGTFVAGETIPATLPQGGRAPYGSYTLSAVLGGAGSSRLILQSYVTVVPASNTSITAARSGIHS